MKTLKLLWQRIRGKRFRVVFRKGGVSAPLTYGDAENYAALFHGVVVPVRDEIPLHAVAGRRHRKFA